MYIVMYRYKKNPGTWNIKKPNNYAIACLWAAALRTLDSTEEVVIKRILTQA